MEALVKITENNGKKAVSARELYEGLGYDLSQWARWYVKNIEKNQFAIEGEDFIQFDMMSKTPEGGRPTKDFILSIDFAKKLSMLARTEKGEQIRNYFIEVEKQMTETYSIPQSFSEALMLAANQANLIEKQQIALSKASKEIQALQPKAELMDKVMDCGEKIDVGQAAKILKLPFGRNTLFLKLRESGIFFQNRNEPKQQYINQGYFEVFEQLIQRNTHDSFMVVKVLVTQKGLSFLNKTFNGEMSDRMLAKLS